MVGDTEMVDAGLAGRLCDACCGVARDLSLTGAAVELWSGPTGDSVIAATSGDGVRVWSRLEFDIGEGPAMQAQRQGRPVLVADLLGVEARDWPGYAIAALEAGIRAIFVVPLLVGATRFGVLVLYSGTVRHLGAAERAVALAAADRIVALLLDHPDSGPAPPVRPGGTEDAGGFVDVLDLRAEVFQAQGMVMAALAVTLPVALSRMRAHASTSGRSLDDVAAAIVARRLVLPRDPPATRDAPRSRPIHRDEEP